MRLSWAVTTTQVKVELGCDNKHDFHALVQCQICGKVPVNSPKKTTVSGYLMLLLHGMMIQWRLTNSEYLFIEVIRFLVCWRKRYWYNLNSLKLKEEIVNVKNNILTLDQNEDNLTAEEFDEILHYIWLLNILYCTQYMNLYWFGIQ